MELSGGDAILHKTHKYPSRHPPSHLAAGLLGPQVWGCGQTEDSLPSWLELALAMQGEEPWWLLRGRVTENVTENSQGEP